MPFFNRKQCLNRLTRFLNSESPSHKTVFSSRTLSTLAFEEETRSPTEKPYNKTAFVIHGLLGSGRNWRSFSRNLASSLHDANPSSEWRRVLLDLRNHGKSSQVTGLHPPHDIFNAAKDVSSLVKTQGWEWPDVVIGHSLGGKVALQFAQSCTHGDYGDSVALPKQVWVLDSVPGKVNPEYAEGEVERVLKALKELPPSFPSARWLVNYMMEKGFSKSLAEWIGSSVQKTGEGGILGFNLEGAIQMFDSYRETSYWSLLEHPPKGMEIGVVVAENSDRWDSDVIQRLESLANQEGDGTVGKVSLHILPKSGHWVHVDNPKGLLEILVPRMSAL